MSEIYVPKPAELGYTFGGREPVRYLRPGDVLTVFTEDCFGGVVKTIDDLPTRMCQMPYLNPVTGPSGGVESGSTVPLPAFSLVSGLSGDARCVRQVSRTGSWCRA